MYVCRVGVNDVLVQCTLGKFVKPRFVSVNGMHSEIIRWRYNSHDSWKGFILNCREQVENQSNPIRISVTTGWTRLRKKGKKFSQHVWIVLAEILPETVLSCRNPIFIRHTMFTEFTQCFFYACRWIMQTKLHEEATRMHLQLHFICIMSIPRVHLCRKASMELARSRNLFKLLSVWRI